MATKKTVSKLTRKASVSARAKTASIAHTDFDVNKVKKYIIKKIEVPAESIEIKNEIEAFFKHAAGLKSRNISGI